MTSQYLTGNYRPVSREITAGPLPVTGQVPPGLRGRYLRNGPNPATPPEPGTYHWFTGDAMIHGGRLAGGRAAGPSGPAPAGPGPGRCPGPSGSRRPPGRCTPGWTSP